MCVSQQLRGLLIELSQPPFTIAEQLQEGSEKQPTEYKPENKERDNQRAKNAPIWRYVHSKISAPTQTVMHPPDRSKSADLVAAMLLMLSGITLTGLFIAFGASLLTRVHWVTMQGLRPARRRGHIIVCGAGSSGSGVIDLLLALGKRFSGCRDLTR